MLQRNPFLSYGLPFIVMIIGSTYVLTEIRSEGYLMSSQAAGSRRGRQRNVYNSLEQDLEDFKEASKVVDEYDMVPVVPRK
jgi:hypothetical protein